MFVTWPEMARPSCAVSYLMYEPVKLWSLVSHFTGRFESSIWSVLYIYVNPKNAKRKRWVLWMTWDKCQAGMIQMDAGRQEEEWTAGERKNHLRTCAHTHTHARSLVNTCYWEVSTAGWWFLLTAKETTDDNSINPVSPLPPSLSIPPSFAVLI